MLNGIRRLISGNRRRLVVDGFDLDLSYITDRIIATSYPSSGLEALYRNTYQQVKKYLDTHHLCHYKVYNLRNEKRYEEDFFDETAEYTFKDHRAPQLSAVVEFCEDACEYLSRDPDNVVVVHCKAGKGRTGVMIASLLIKLGEAKDAEEAIKIYGDQRTVDGRGVTIPSQRRYVSYYSTFLLHSQKAKEKQLIVHSISLLGQQNAVTINDDYFLSIKLPTESAVYNHKVKITKIGDLETRIELFENRVVCKDFTVAMWRLSPVGLKTKLFAFSLHTDYVMEDLILRKDDIDLAVNDKQCDLYSNDFRIAIH